MMSKTYSGNCHCGAVRLTLHFDKNAGDITPKACDCDFCYKHGAQYVSDPKGRVEVQCADYELLTSYGSPGKLTRYLFCNRCGNLIGSEFSADGYHFMIVNGRMLNEFDHFPEPDNVHADTRALSEQIVHWQQHWFQDVKYL